MRDIDESKIALINLVWLAPFFFRFIPAKSDLLFTLTLPALTISECQHFAYDVFKGSSYFLFCVIFFITNARHNAVLRRPPDVYASPGGTKTTHNLG
ncbi:hypothetical protein DB992_00085 [Salmonella enterica]|nr:hypothetical protein [Salmonella enterica]